MHGFGTNPETLLALAWGACQPGLRDALIEARQQQKASEQVLRSRLMSSLPPVFQQDPVYGLAYHRLFLHRLEQVEYTFVEWALRGYSSVYLRDGDEASATNESTVLWEAITQDERLAGCLKQLSREWQGDVQRGAYALRLHFFMHMPLVQTAECPFLVQTFLVMSLQRINWGELAALLLGVAYTPPAMTEEDGDEDGAMRFATLLEWIWTAQVNIGKFVLEPQLSRRIRDRCAELQDWCGHYHQELCALWEEGMKEQ